VEPSDAVALGPALAAANAVADRITFTQGLSSGMRLSRRADVLVEDLRGVSPLHGGRLGALLDARARLLEPGARLIPRRDRLMVAPAPAPPSLAVEGVANGTHEAHEAIDLTAVRERLRHAFRRVRTDQLQPLSPPAEWATLDYATFTSEHLAGAATCTLTSHGRVDGLAAWFEADLAPGIGFSTGPSPERTVYDMGWFPLATSLDAAAGDTLDVRLRATFDGSEYVWGWDTEWRPHDGRAAPVRQRQSNLLQRALSPERLARRAAAHVPRLGEGAALLRDALALADGSRSLGAIAALVRERAPTQFATNALALRWLTARLTPLEEDDAT
jgi:protein arginine N-methyltransferase 1